MKKIYLSLLVLMLISFIAEGQVYIEKQTRHRFAQLNLGVDMQSSIGGQTQYLDANNTLKTLPLSPSYTPRIVIGGTHFWGHADFYLAIPIASSTLDESNQKIIKLNGVETVFKYYPWRIEHNKLRPYLGFSLTPFYYEQSNNNLEFGSGPELNHTSVPIYGGLTFNNKNHLIELGLMWNYKNNQSYYISRDKVADIQTSPLSVNISYRFMLETTLSAEKSWESGRTEEITKKLEEDKKLNSFYLGVGLSSAFWIGNHTYNATERPYIEQYRTSIMPDFTLGYYFHKLDLNLAFAYRGYGTSTNTYGAIQQLNRKSLVLEAAKSLFDYHGFVPFIGPSVGYEGLKFKESFENLPTYDKSENKMSYGLVFGWDIRPNRLQQWVLRTNLRWFPNLNLEIENDKKVSFDNIEFNFIQLIIYPNRMIKKKPVANNNLNK